MHISGENMPLTYEKLIQFDLVDTALDQGHIVQLINLASEIHGVNQFIIDAPSFPGSTDKISRGEMAQAIGSTLAIEGTEMKKEEIEESIRKASMNEALERREREAENSRKVYHFIVETVNNSNKEKFVYSEAIIQTMHKLFTSELNYLSNEPGKYRSNFITTFGEPRQTGLCKTQDEIERAMKAFVGWLNKKNSDNWGDLAPIKAVMAHYYLSEIHAFGDGNGRTARAVEALLLYESGINTYCFWSLANFWSANKSEYLAQLRNVRETCNPWEFILWGINGFLQEITRIKSSVLIKLKQLMLTDYTRYLLNNKKHAKIKINQRIVAVIEFLINIGSISLSKFPTTPQISALYSNVTSSTISRDFRKMADLGLIKVEEKEGQDYISPNYKILDHVQYFN